MKNCWDHEQGNLAQNDELNKNVYYGAAWLVEVKMAEVSCALQKREQLKNRPQANAG